MEEDNKAAMLDRADRRAELEGALTAISGEIISETHAEIEGKRWAHAVEQERYASEIREVLADYRALEERLLRIGERYPDFGRPLLLSKMEARPNPGKAYWQARRNVLIALFEDERTGKMEYAKLRTAYMREAERNAGYLGTLPDDIWHSSFGAKTQATADRLLMQNGMIQTDAHGKLAEKLNTLAKLYRRIVAHRNGQQASPSRSASCGKTFSGKGRVEFMPGKRINWFGSVVKWRNDRDTIRCMVATTKGRENISIVKVLAEKPFSVSEATVQRWIANADALTDAAEYSALAQRRDENERVTGWRVD